MFLKAGALSLALLLASRVLGLARESAQASAFGASGMADVAVLMLTFPDWLAGLLASGAFAYVLVPAWSMRTGAEVAASQRRLTVLVLAAAVLLAVGLVVGSGSLATLLAGGLPAPWRPSAASGLIWSAVALPAALLAALWATRLQHERDFTGMYAANLVVNAVLIVAIAAAARPSVPSIPALGLGLAAAMLLRLAWLHLRVPRSSAAAAEEPPLPAASVWWWAALSAGLPLALPFVARSIASQAGPGALAVFNYAWKLVELPLVLAIQMVAALAFPMIARAMKEEDPQRTSTAVRASFALAWTLACAAVAGLCLAAPSVARLLFGWGRMDASSLATLADWGRIGAWSLLPQAVIAVALNVLASRTEMRHAVVAYAIALSLLLMAASAGLRDGASLMALLDVLLAGVAVVMLWPLRLHWRDWLPWRAFASAAVVALVAAALARFAPMSLWAGLGAGVLGAVAALSITWWLSPDLRRALAR